MRIPEIEFASAEEIEKCQNEKLIETVLYLNSNSKFYQEMFQREKINPFDIKTVSDLKKIPFTSKDDLHNRNEDFICVSKNQISDYVTTSGTIGDPVTFALTDRDLDRLAYNEYISFICADGSSEDIYQLMCTLDRRFMAGLAYFLGIRKLGAGIIRVGNGLPELQWDTIKRIKPTALVGVPSFILKMIEYAEHNGIDCNDTSVVKAICIGENIRKSDFSYNTLGKNITDKWNIKLYSTYASTEKGTSFTECGAGTGGHLHPELIIAEVIDENGNDVGEGETGELVFTTLGVEGMPLLRYRSGDLCQFFSSPCECGRNTLRLGPIIGRRHHMIKYRGTTLYPPALYDVLDSINEVIIYYVEVFTNEIGTDEILIHVNAKGDQHKIESLIKDKIRAKVRVAPKIVFEESEIIRKIVFPELSRKSQKFLDRRL